MERFLFSLVAAGFLSVALIACAGGGEDSGGGSGGSMGNVSIDDEPETDPENGAPGNGDTNADVDGDGETNDVDVDDDGDGLIEISTADELDAVRHQLDGSGYRSTANGNLDQTGCGGADGITQCNGYELVANISLAAYVDNDNGKGWQPLGRDTNGNTDGCDGDAFDGIFEGNGFMISDLNINRPTEDCVGLFGHIAANSEIRDLTLHAEAVSGKNRVGTLVGSGDSARIISSLVEVGVVRGDSTLGGLVGKSRLGQVIYSSVVAAGVVSGTDATNTGIGGLVGGGDSVQIHSSLAVVGEISGGQNVGGLVGNGRMSRIYSSLVVAGNVSGSEFIGGLAGWGHSAMIHSSSVVVGEMIGGSSVGGLAGEGASVRIVSSSVVVGELSGSDLLAGLVGGDFSSGKVAYSYVVSGSDITMLAGLGNGEGVASYWDSETSGFTSSGNHGEAKTTGELRSPTGYADLYASWNQDMDIFGNEDEPLAVWCDEDNSESIEGDEKINDNLIWDFGTSSQYPAIRCTPLDPDDWRNWWSLQNGKPALNQARLNNLLP